MEAKDGDKVYEGNPLRKLYQCECWMSHMWGICPAIIVVANHEANMKPSLDECFTHFNVSSNTFDSKSQKNVKTFQKRKRPNWGNTKFDSFFGFLSRSSDVPGKFHFLASLTMKTLKTVLQKMVRKVKVSLTSSPTANTPIKQADVLLSLIVGTALGNELKCCVDGTESPRWLAQHIVELDHNEKRKHNPATRRFDINEEVDNFTAFDIEGDASLNSERVSVSGSVENYVPPL